MANEKVNRYLNVYITTGEAQKALDILLAKEKKLTEELKLATDPKKVTQLKTELARLAEPIDRATKKVKGELVPTIRDLEAATKKYINEFKRTGDPEALRKFHALNSALRTQRDRISEVATAQRSISKDFFSSFFGNVAANLVMKAGSAISNFFEGTTEEALQAEDAIAGLANSLENAGRTDLLEKLIDQSEEFAERFRRLDNDDITNVFTKLIDYGKLTEAQIKETTEVIINYAAKQKISLAEATDAIVKGLEGNGRALKTYGINIKNAKTDTERYSAVVGDLGKKLQGAELAFEKTGRGFGQSFGQRIRDLQERVGKFFLSLVGLERQSYNNALAAKREADQGTVLVARYEELTKKAHLTTDEKIELDNITRQLVTTFGSSIVEINKETGALVLNVEATKSLIKQKLLLANNKAVEIASKLNAAQEKLSISTTELGVQTVLLNAKQKELGKTFEEVEAIVFRGNASSRRELDKTPALKTLFDIGVNARTATKDVKNLNKEISGFVSDLEKLGFKKEDVDKLFTPGDPLKPVGTATSGNSGSNDEDKKAADARKKLLEELANIRKALSLALLPAFDRELAELKIKYDKLTEQAKGEKKILLDIQELFEVEKVKLIRKYAAIEVGTWAKGQEDLMKKAEDAFKANLERLKSIGEAIRAETDINADLAVGNFDRDRLTRLENDIFKADGKEKFDLQKEHLEEQERQAVQSMEKTAGLEKWTTTQVENEKQKIRNEFAERNKELEVSRFQKTVDDVLEFAGQLANIWGAIGQAQTEKENAELARDQKLNDKKKANLESRLKKGTISQQQYDREVQKMEKDADKKKHEIEVKQFKRNQRMQIIQSVMNGAAAVTKILAEYPKFDFGVATAIGIGLAIATTAAQVLTISKQKPPELAKGGKLGGAYHSEGGNPIIDGRTGRKIAEIEKGEGVVNRHTMADKKQYTVSGTASQIISGLNGMHGVSWDRGARIIPAWRTAKQPSMNFPAIRKYYALGGEFARGNTSNTSAAASTTSNAEITAIIAQQQVSNEMMRQTVADMQSTIANLAAQLSGGIKAYTLLSDQEKQSKRIEDIRADATMK